MSRELAAAHILEAYMNFLSQTNGQPSHIGTEVGIPQVPEAMLLDLCKSAIETFKNRKALIWIESPITVVGDLHGDLQDLMRIWHAQEKWYESKVVFLGDYVDRGDFQLEVVTVLLALAVQYPAQVSLLRGNHEFESVNSIYGFREQVMARYSEKVWKAFNEVFSYLPLAAVIDKRFFCVHGGLSPRLNTLADIESLQLPIREMDDPLVSHLLWSDPGDCTCDFVTGSRGRGLIFGLKAVDDFLAKNNLRGVLRAHENVPTGVKTMFDGKLVKVFSSSGYGASQDKAGYVKVWEDGRIEPFILAACQRVEKQNVHYTPLREKVQKPLGAFLSFRAQTERTDRSRPKSGLKKVMSMPGLHSIVKSKSPAKQRASCETEQSSVSQQSSEPVLSPETMTLENLIGC